MTRIHSIALAGAAALALGLGTIGTAPTFAAEMTKMVGGAAMYPSKNIMQNAVNSKDHTTLVAAVKAAGLVQTLEGARARSRCSRRPTKPSRNCPTAPSQTLLKPENKDKLTSILTYHVVTGRLTTKDLREKIKDGGGKAELKTVEGEPLTVTEKDGHLWLIDAKGDKAEITIANVMQSNGVIQVINTVMLPG